MDFKITDGNIHKFVNMYYVGNKRKNLPPEIRNVPIGEWDVSNVTNMHLLFAHKTRFNEPLNTWNVSRVTNMSNMFNGATAFNQPIGDWNVSRVTNMKNIFKGATSFNQSIKNWNITKVLFELHVTSDGGNPRTDNTLMQSIFQGSGLSIDNYPRPRRVKYNLVDLTPQYLRKIGYNDKEVNFITTQLLTEDDTYEEFDNFMTQKMKQDGKDYFDIISLTVFIDPVKVIDQSNIEHTYERNSIIKLYNDSTGTPISPFTRRPLPLYLQCKRNDEKRGEIKQLMNEYIASLHRTPPPSEGRRSESRSRSRSKPRTHPNPYLALSVSSSPSRVYRKSPQSRSDRRRSPTSLSIPRKSPTSRSIPRGSPPSRSDRRRSRSPHSKSPISLSIPRKSSQSRSDRRRSRSPHSKSPTSRSIPRGSPPSRSVRRRLYSPHSKSSSPHRESPR